MTKRLVFTFYPLPQSLILSIVNFQDEQKEQTSPQQNRELQIETRRKRKYLHWIVWIYYIHTPSCQHQIQVRYLFVSAKALLNWKGTFSLYIFFKLKNCSKTMIAATPSCLQLAKSTIKNSSFGCDTVNFCYAFCLQDIYFDMYLLKVIP